jgi:hypothetical protein
MLAPLASLDLLKALMNESFSGPGEETQAETALAIVSEWARGISGQTWLTGDVPGDIQAVVLTAARRDLDNPSGYIRQSMGSLNVEIAPSRIPDGFFTNAEMAILKRFRRHSGLSTISTYREDDDWLFGYLYTLPDDTGKPMRVFHPDDGPVNGAMYL